MEKKIIPLAAACGVVAAAVIFSMVAIRNGGFLLGQVAGSDFTIVDNVEGPKYQLVLGPGARRTP